MRSFAARCPPGAWLASANYLASAAARRYYNQSVYRYHTVKQSFPAVLIAKPFGFRGREFFGTDERDAPVVSFAQQ